MHIQRIYKKPNKSKFSSIMPAAVMYLETNCTMDKIEPSVKQMSKNNNQGPKSLDLMLKDS
ncbi:unnamed protein product [Acanthoscelides obtectus]|uniref:Uncharacterized protein n=1 Tax=Acanthoscelides obtectus TaxID=200917 RepID=A0A9P0Q0Q5_ACAOB|nr:unnamed protein product [Acanthoscelides obtectus]CAK1639312.1 hypothetical protein AOBTE_LOCUS11117 [Acanthoscelides obtectus]